MRNITFLFILTLFLSLSNNVNAHNSLTYSITFSSEESSKSIISTKETKPKSIEPTKQTTIKEQRKIAKQNRKEFRKNIWESLKQNRKINKENRKNRIKDANPKIHWAAYVSFFGALVAIGIIAAAIILNSATYAIFSFLIPLALGLLVLSVITSIIGISAVASDDITLYHKSKTITLALIGGIISLLSLLFIGFVILAVSAIM